MSNNFSKALAQSYVLQGPRGGFLCVQDLHPLGNPHVLAAMIDFLDGLRADPPGVYTTGDADGPEGVSLFVTPPQLALLRYAVETSLSDTDEYAAPGSNEDVLALWTMLSRADAADV